MSAADHDELLAQLLPLVEALLDGALSAEQGAQLRTLLETEPAACERYADLLAMHALLKRDLSGQHLVAPMIAEADSPATPAAPLPLPAARPGLSLPVRLTGYPLGALAAMAGLWLALWAVFGVAVLPWRGQAVVAEAEGDGRGAMRFSRAARIVNGEGVAWADEAKRFAVGDSLPRGTELNLAAGTLTVEFAGGARVTLQAPVQFTVQPLGAPRVPGLGYLAAGQLIARVPGRAHGFTVQTEKLAVVDLGTEFGVLVDPQQGVEIHVAEGRVATYRRNESNAPEAALNVLAGESLTFDQHSGQLARGRADFARFAGITPAAPATLNVDFGEPVMDTLHGHRVQDDFVGFYCRDGQSDRAQSQSFTCGLGRDDRVDISIETRSGTPLVWRDRGEMAAAPMGALIEDFVNSGSALVLTLTNLKAGEYRLTTYHHDLHKAHGTIELVVEASPGARSAATEVAMSGLEQEPAQGEVVFAADGLQAVRIHIQQGTSPHALLNGFVLSGITPEADASSSNSLPRESDL